MTFNDRDSDDVIDKASIIENKERTKIYWEQLMMAAAKENNSAGKMRQWTVADIKKSDSSCNRKNLYSCKDSNIIGEETARNYDDDWDSDSDLISSKNRLNETSGKKNNSKKNQPLTMEGKIAMELREMKEREEELKEWRSKISIESCKVISLPKDGLITNGNDELMSSLHTTDESNYSEYGSEEKEHSLDENGSRVNTPYSEEFMHGRTQSLDSVSSGHSSGSGSTLNERERELLKRKVMVRPYEDPEEEEQYPCYIWDGKETPIEREIRLAREREEELRREKGMANVIENCRALSRQMKNKSERLKETMENDPRGIQHRLATSRIQQEIEEANERERELRTEGKIISTSEETLDSKVTRLEQLVENSIFENRYREQKVKRSSLLLSDRMFAEKNENRENQLSGKCKGNGGKKGVMEKFFSMKGKPFVSGLNVQSHFSDEEFQPRPIARQLLNSNGDVIVHTRKGYTPVAEKIQEELKDNKMREEELRLQRARMLARSQPNLVDIFENEEERETSWKSREEFESSPAPAPRLVHSVSNPNLLDDSFDKVHKRPSSKKFSLLEEWEKRIRENNQKE